MPLDGSYQRRTGSALQLPPEGDDLLGRAAQVDDGLVVGPHVCFEARRVADVRVRAHEIGPSCGRAAALIASVLEAVAHLGIDRRVDAADVEAEVRGCVGLAEDSSEEHTSEPQSLMRNSYAVVCLK